MTAEDKQALIERACQLALDYEKQYGCCPQCVLAAISETAGVVTDDVIKASHGFSGGGGLTGIGFCGALAGGVLALGCHRGRSRADFDKGKFIGNFQACRNLMERFKEEHGGVMCQELQREFTGRNYDFWDTEEFANFKKARGDGCCNAIVNVTRWTLEAILNVN